MPDPSPPPAELERRVDEAADEPRWEAWIGRSYGECVSLGVFATEGEARQAELEAVRRWQEFLL